ncbi:hypothetical protein [Flyfo microvirus Tbat2_116]|nr:hypothetical protein [Flyfo microvirus Tbat2_116]
MYKQIRAKTSSIKVNESYEGESIEDKVHRIVNNGEPISDSSPRVFTERKDGVKPEYDIRTDRFDLAVEATDKITNHKLAKREERQALRAVKGGDEGGKDAGGKSIDTTSQK